MNFPVIERVQVEGLVLLKMIMHYEEEALLNNNFVNGILLGLAQGNQLVVTNCFFLPKVQDDDPDALEVSGNFEVYTDHLNVGIYQASPGGVAINRANIDNIYYRQINLPEAVLLTYDPMRTSRGQIGLKAYRLSADVLTTRSEAERRLRFAGPHKGSEAPWECEAVSNTGRNNFTRVLEEIPVVIHNSHLVNILLTQIVDNRELSRSEQSVHSILDLAPPLPKDHAGRFSALNLSMAASLEQQLRSLLTGLDTVHDCQYLYQRTLSKFQTSVSGKVFTVKSHWFI